MNIAKAIDREETLTFDWESEPVEIRFKPNTVTAELAVTLENLNTVAELIERLAPIVSGWNLDWNGELFPPNAENMSKVPASFIREMFQRMAEVWSGNGQKPRKLASASAPSA